jgi:hypothetical protein
MLILPRDIYRNGEMDVGEMNITPLVLRVLWAVVEEYLFNEYQNVVVNSYMVR